MGNMGGGDWEGEREEGLFSLCQLGGKALSQEPSSAFPHTHSLGFVAGASNAVGNVKSPVALPLPLGAGIFL